MSKRTEWVRTVSGTATLKLAEAEEVDRYSRREVGMVHGISGREAE